MDLETFFSSTGFCLKSKVIESNDKEKNMFLNFWTNFPKM